MEEEGAGIGDAGHGIDQGGAARAAQLDGTLDRDRRFGTDSVEETHMVSCEAVLAAAVQTQHAYNAGTADQGNGSNGQQDTELGGIVEVTRLNRPIPIDDHSLCFGYPARHALAYGNPAGGEQGPIRPRDMTATH